MNFVRCRAISRDSTEVDCNGALIAVRHAADLEAGELLLGIRPEDLLIKQEKQGAGIGVTVSVIEPAGSFNWVEIFWNGSRLRGKAGPEERLQPGSTAFLTFSREKLFLFDEASGKRV
jgi:ABC-type sugar transport system ATPase subunit